MKNNFVKLFPKINHAVIFRTDTESNHGFPDPINCPKTIGRKSLALYYYINDKSLFRRTKYFYARWKRRPGIDEPRFDDSQNIFITTELINVAMATSGVYRKYKIDSNGRKYAHILDPLSGIPAKTNILSVSVISETCIDADAYATALHLMNINEIEDFLIYNKDVSLAEVKIILKDLLNLSENKVIYENESREIIGKAYNDF